MSMRTLLAVLDPRAANHVLLETACAFGAEWKSRLDVLLPYPQLWNPDVISVADEMARERVVEIEEHARQIETAIGERARQEFTSVCDRFGIAIASDPTVHQPPPFARWFTVSGFDRGCRTVDRAKVADLVLVRRPDVETGEGYENLIGLVLRGSGRPVMALPPAHKNAGQARIAIAWNGSVESVRAVSAAMDFLNGANTIDLLTAESEKTHSSAADRLVRYLACRNITVRKHIFPKGGNRLVGEMVLDKCYELASDLLVMGGKTHNRWREMGFGGVTRHVLAHAELPVVLAH